MEGVAISQARDNLAELINEVLYQGDRICLIRRGKPVGALVSIEDLAILEELEKKIDIAEARKALKKGEFVSWKKFKKQLGL